MGFALVDSDGESGEIPEIPITNEKVEILAGREISFAILDNGEIYLM